MPNQKEQKSKCCGKKSKDLVGNYPLMQGFCPCGKPFEPVVETDAEKADRIGGLTGSADYFLDKSEKKCFQKENGCGITGAGIIHKSECLSKTNTVEDWNQEFEELYNYAETLALVGKGDYEGDKKALKDFIKNLLSAERERIVEIGESLKSKQKIDNGHDCYENNCDYCENSLKDQTIIDYQSKIKSNE